MAPINEQRIDAAVAVAQPAAPTFLHAGLPWSIVSIFVGFVLNALAHGGLGTLILFLLITFGTAWGWHGTEKKRNWSKFGLSFLALTTALFGVMLAGGR